MFLTVNGIRVHVQQSGPRDAPVLLLLHSLGTQAAIWEPVDEALSSQYRIPCPDFRGHGLTDVTPGPYTVDGLAEDMLALLDAVGVAYRRHLARGAGGTGRPGRSTRP